MMSSLSLLILPALVAGGTIILLLLTRALIFRLMRRWRERGERTERTYRVLTEALGIPSIFWCIAIGLYAGMEASDLPGHYLSRLTTLINVLLVISVTIAAAAVAAKMFRAYALRLAIPVSGTGLVDGAIKGSILVVGILVALSMLGISIAPLLTALGVGGLAVALALQDTLANLFSGFHILVERSIRVGDFVRIESGQEGYVDDITWRTTRIRMLTNNMVLIPNRKMAQSVVVNYSLPGEPLTVAIGVRADMAAEPETVERIIAEEVRSASAEIPGLLPAGQPSVTFGTGDAFIEFTVSVEVDRFVSQFGVGNELRKRLYRRLRQEGMEYPNRRAGQAQPSTGIR